MDGFITEIFILILGLQSTVSGLVRSEDEKFSFMRQKCNTRLKNHVIGWRTTPSFITCTQYCLMHASCKSVNYKVSGLCELNDAVPTGEDIESHKDFTLSWFISVQSETFVFTTLGGRGQEGPTNIRGYEDSNLEGKVQVDNGIQTWIVPMTGKYVITAKGASGANGTCQSNCAGWSRGGNGARITGSFTLKKGTQLRLLVGQQGSTTISTESPGGGGGGSFVTFTNSTPLIIAGGGGGGGITAQGIQRDGEPGQESGNGSRYGGSNGQGGQRYDIQTKSLSPGFFSSAGAGLLTDGDAIGGETPKSFINGGKGGRGTSEGGFGGGGFALAYSPGGGGGYSGGGVMLDNNIGLAGGGGSFNAGYDQLNIQGTNRGDGQIVISLVI